MSSLDMSLDDLSKQHVSGNMHVRTRSEQRRRLPRLSLCASLLCSPAAGLGRPAALEFIARAERARCVRAVQRV